MAVKKRSNEKILEINATMQGELTFKDPVNLTINGNFQGKLNTKGALLVGKDAYVGAEIIGEDITIAGKIDGNIVAQKRLTLIPPANVKGEIKTPILIVEEGATLNGECIMKSEITKFLTLEEMATYLKIDRETLLNWVEDNKIPVMREGSKYLFDRKEVENWL